MKYIRKWARNVADRAINMADRGEVSVMFLGLKLKSLGTDLKNNVNTVHCWLERIDNSKTSAELYESNFYYL